MYHCENCGKNWRNEDVAAWGVVTCPSCHNVLRYHVMIEEDEAFFTMEPKCKELVITLPDKGLTFLTYFVKTMVMLAIIALLCWLLYWSVVEQLWVLAWGLCLLYIGTSVAWWLTVTVPKEKASPDK